MHYNAGPGSVAAGHEMMRAVDKGNVKESNFTVYHLVKVNGKFISSPGLLNRREAEYLIYSKGIY